jgi:hypothetical protein
MGCLTDADVDAMVAASAAFKKLEALNLNDNGLTEASRPKIGALAKHAVFGEEQDPDRASDDHYRYVSVSE